jgi:hypothetical protein
MKRIIIFLLVTYFATSFSFAQEDTITKINNTENDTKLEIEQPTTQASPASEGEIPGTNPKSIDKTATANLDNSTQNNYTTGALLQGLNKITARTSKLAVTFEHPIKFGNLSIILHSCWKSPPEDAPENKALLEMWEEIPGEVRKKIFSGWMFSSSPLISAPEHPVYDITLLECTGKAR